MSLRLVSTGDERARAIRDHLLPLIDRDGTNESADTTMRVTVLALGPWLMHHWTPLDAPTDEEAASPGYRRALARQRKNPGLRHRLDVRRAAELLLDIQWSDDGAVQATVFVRGSWEDEAPTL